MACHIRYASENARLGLPEVTLGLIPGYGGTQRLPKLVGKGIANEMIFSAKMIPAQKAKEIGLVNHVVTTKEEAFTLAEKIMNKIFSKGPRAIAALIKSVNEGYGQEREGYQAEAKNFAELTATKDFMEGTSAFLEKRKANFKGE